MVHLLGLRDDHRRLVHARFWIAQELLDAVQNREGAAPAESAAFETACAPAARPSHRPDRLTRLQRFTRSRGGDPWRDGRATFLLGGCHALEAERAKLTS